MKSLTRLRTLTLAAACAACLALSAPGAQKSQGGGETSGDGGGRLYPVLVNWKWGYVDRTGKMVIEPKYDNEAYFSDGVAVVMSGLNPEAIEQAEPVGNTVVIPAGPGGVKWEIIDVSGKALAELPGDKGYLSSFFTDGLARISGWEEGKGSIYGYMDKAGRVVIKPQFDNAGVFREGLADACVESGRCGFIDRTGKFVVPPIYKEVRPFSEELAVVITRGGRAGFVNKSGEVVIKPQFSSHSIFGFSEGLAAVAKADSDKFGFIDKLGQFRIQPAFERAGDFLDGLAPVLTNGRWGYIDREGRFVIAPQFAFAGSFSEGLATASMCIGLEYQSRENTGRCGYGYIDKTGRFVIDQRFDEGGPFRDGRAHVIADGARGYIDCTGNILWRPHNR